MENTCEYCKRKMNCNSGCPLKDISREAETMQSFLEVTTSENPKELIQRLSDINVYLARSGKLLADAKEFQDESTSAIYNDYEDFITKVPATVSIKFINSKISYVNKLVNWLDRLNRAFVHTGDNIRTQLSFAKEELRLTKNGY